MSMLAPDQAINTTSIDQANSTVLCARELAAQTGTELIVYREGVIARIKPYPGNNRNEAQEIPTQYEDAP